MSGRGLANVIIYSIGLGNAPYPLSPSFLERVSNDPNSPIFDISKPGGNFVQTYTAEGLQPLLRTVASLILLRKDR